MSVPLGVPSGELPVIFAETVWFCPKTDGSGLVVITTVVLAAVTVCGMLVEAGLTL